ncbi:thiamine pyrophosphate-dependent enzyme [Methanomassiliicoccus luminyensis]|jgi:pyruvate ferredoxin oxidoreductase beta subunit|uniref:thiamine pyrophosphate-dependent enzyme n=1 Tax=Methanomassiliicoccus luminyensis TaxID=1080712 RepID=UPI0003766854|nr:thiamine pyrophosphate-dependent enzyme [Methanomassiliicoccus luminyensis]
MITIKELAEQPVKLTEGHRLCAGCSEPIAVRQVLMATNKPVVVSNATGCFEVSTSGYPYSAWNIPWIHSAFGNAAATISGVESAYRVLKKKGKVQDDMRFAVFAGDGATYDIGFQALSGAIERGHQFLFVCLNNEAYMNTGIQRSGATGRGAATTTCPSGTCIPGKREFPKDFTKIIAAHELPYAAQASPHNWRDMVEKAGKGFECGGPAFINAITPCPRGWRYEPQLTVEIAKLAVETCVWPLYEYERGKWTLTGESKRIAEGSMEKRPVTDWIKAQGRFKHLQDPKWSSVVDEIQENVDFKWEELLRLSKQ